MRLSAALWREPAPESRRLGPLLLTAALLAVGVTATSGAEATPSSQDRALAEALFQEGKELTQSSKLAEACKKFEESWALDPALGTKLHIAACYEELGRTASAWAAYSEALELARRSGDRDRVTLSEERVARLSKSLSRLTIEVSDAPAGLEVLLDGKALGAGSLGTALPVDPGEHAIVVRAPGHREWTATITVEVGPGSDTLSVPALERLTPGPDATEPEDPPGVTASTSGLGTQALVGLVVGGVGVVGVGVGAYFGLRAGSQQRDADELCSGRFCSPEGLKGHDDARQSATWSNIGFGVGAAGLAAGTVLFLTAPAKAKPERQVRWVSPVLLQRGAGIAAAGVF